MSLVDAIIGVWERRLSIVIIGTIVVALAVLYLNIATYTYTAQIKVASVDLVERQRGGGALSSLAAVAGVGFREPLSDPQFELYIEGLTSAETAEVLVQDPRIMRTIYRGFWRESEQRFVEPPPSLRQSVTNGIKGVLGLPIYPWQEPNALRLSSYLTMNIQISRSKDSIISTITFVDEDRDFGVYFLETLHNTVNERLRQRAIRRSTASIKYLKEQLDIIQVSEYRQALLQALSEQERIRMTASSGLPFAAEIISGPSSPENPDRPRALVTLALAILLGGVLGTMFAFTRFAIADAKARRRRAAAEPVSVPI